MPLAGTFPLASLTPAGGHRFMPAYRDVILMFGLAACTTAEVPPTTSAAEPDYEYLTPYGAPTLPFSPGVRVGNLIILSGVLGTTGPDNRLVEGGIRAETRQALENIKDVLQRSGSSMDRVIKCTAMLADMSEWAAMNEIYVQYFPVNKPARSAFGATALALGARMELECWAMTGDARAPARDTASTGAAQ